ncbi:MAG TPA: acyltransferase [Phycisphaerae bacterium]|nr:acyltransferase [Phycisphaerae bacterium]
MRGLIIALREAVRWLAIIIRCFVLRRLYGMRIDPSARIAFGARLDKTNPQGIVIGPESYIASGALILAHDFARSTRAETIIGCQCFIGANAIILPGVKIGDNVIVGAGAVVARDVGPNSIVVGNPARVIRTGISTGQYGKCEETTNRH